MATESGAGYGLSAGGIERSGCSDASGFEGAAGGAGG
jgi:hypothetical protein